MAEIGGVDLSKKIGPVPIWVIVGVGGLGLAYFINRQFAGPGGGSESLVESGIGGMPGGFVPAPKPEDTAPVLGPLDNEEWATAAVSWLLSQGYNPIEAGVAVRRYLDGERLTSRELTLITLVTKAIGVPPNIPVGGGVIPSPGVTPTPVKRSPVVVPRVPIGERPGGTTPVPRRPPTPFPVYSVVPRADDTRRGGTVPRR